MFMEKLDGLLKKESKSLKTLQFGMSIPQWDEVYYYSDTFPQQQFHSTSVGKVMTATLIFMAVECGRLGLNTPLHTIIEQDLLSGLFVHKGQDFQTVVQVGHLLGHTSGINDYFEGKTLDGTRFLEVVLTQRDKCWTPQELLDFTRKKQQALAKPGERFFYSDTGYVLLGIIVEKIFEMPFHEALETYIFNPLGMKNTGLSFYSENFYPSQLAPLFFKKVDTRLFQSLSCDFSGGGVFTTTEDLLTFFNAFQDEKLIGKASMERMASFQHRFHVGMHYGLGLMEIRFKEFFFLLRHLPNLRGHVGISGAHAWYNPVDHSVFILNVGNAKHMGKSFRLLMKILQLVEKEKKIRQQK